MSELLACEVLKVLPLDELVGDRGEPLLHLRVPDRGCGGEHCSDCRAGRCRNALRPRIAQRRSLGGSSDCLLEDTARRLGRNHLKRAWRERADDEA